MSTLTEIWRNYLSEKHDETIEQLAATYPEKRSLYVDLLVVYDFDEAFLERLLANPSGGFAAGESVLRDLTGVTAPVHIRVENNPQQRKIARTHAHHVGDLVTVTGVIETVRPPQASTVSAAYECPVCETSVTISQTGLDMASPTRCDDCGWNGEFTFLPEQSQFVDFQEVTLTSPEDAESDFIAELPAYLDDDIVGTVSEDNRYSLTGVIRAHQESDTNEFLLYLDVLSVRNEAQMSAPDTLNSIIDSHWKARE